MLHIPLVFSDLFPNSFIFIQGYFFSHFKTLFPPRFPDSLTLDSNYTVKRFLGTRFIISHRVLHIFPGLQTVFSSISTLRQPLNQDFSKMFLLSLRILLKLSLQSVSDISQISGFFQIHQDLTYLFSFHQILEFSFRHAFQFSNLSFPEPLKNGTQHIAE